MQISESLKLFGAKDDSNSVVAVFTSDSSDSFIEQVFIHAQWQGSDVSSHSTYI